MVNKIDWIYLLVAGVFEMGWPLGFKLSLSSEHKVWWLVFSYTSMALSGIFLWFAQRTIPIGTAYAVWTGIGAVGTLVIGITYFNDSSSIMRIVSALLIITGIIGLKMAS